MSLWEIDVSGWPFLLVVGWVYLCFVLMLKWWGVGEEEKHTEEK